jgi:hypothetical protein
MENLGYKHPYPQIRHYRPENSKLNTLYHEIGHGILEIPQIKQTMP